MFKLFWLNPKPDAVNRFEREVQAAAQLSHPNIVTAYDAGQASDTHFFAMEYVEGTDLHKLVEEKGALSVAQACDCIRQAAAGLQHAHEQGLVHRDIKPHNLLLTTKAVVKILDMGLARLRQANEGAAVSQGLTQEGACMGTPSYMAPEQALDTHKADIRADIYSLGCTLYFLLSGRTPFEGSTVAQVLIQHQMSEAEPITQAPADMAAVVRKMMAKKPEDRYQTPAEVAEALGSVAASSFTAVTPTGSPLMPVVPSVAESETMNERVARSPGATLTVAPSGRQRRRWFLVAGGAAALLLVVALFVMLSRPTEKPPQAGATVPDSPSGPPDSLTLDLGDSIKLELVLIKKGSFTMGSPESDKEADFVGDAYRAVEKPQHTVEISSDLRLGKYPVTQEQYQRIMGTNPSHFSKDGEGKNLVKGLNTTHFPVENVNWNDAREFCEKLSQKTKRRVELPSEAQWEYACRAGTTTRYYCGDVLDIGLANFSISFGRTTEVGHYQKNPWGLYDMAGNVWQWCADGPRPYTGNKCTDPFGVGDSWRVLRGGAWNSAPCRAAFRRKVPPSDRAGDRGFRVLVCLD